MTMLAAYGRVRNLLAEARLVQEVLDIRVQVEHIRLHARQIADRDLLAEATVFQLETERKLGEMLRAAIAAGQIAEGRRPKGDTERVTLEEIGIAKKLSAKAQKAAGLSPAEFEALSTATREKIKSGRAIVVDPVDDSGIIHGARAIMSGRVEPDDSLDYFPTPPCATRALIEKVFAHLKIKVDASSAREPACGEGHIAEVLREYFANVSASDIFDYGYGDVADFLDEHTSQTADWFITNPPFDDKAEAFLTRMLKLARVGVAMFVRLQWLEGEGRYQRIFDPAMTPPTLVAFFSERIALCKGRWDPEGGTATAYIWLVWIKGRKPQAPFWIPPVVVDELTRPDDAERFTQHPVMRRVA
ncbi:hypothetical protein [Bradyrhizobium liaoningense]|uniref:hypothetical protein n=2 Tax=Bradyrhizobium liaoningense TaxID=43992 RepID=UPI0004B94C75|nr:hypothetical protein [Bradyrhizobium liaoningense]GLR92846.1 hypothetical protein GCM10007858_04680 [Bradyrhizobium liaoningense]